MHTQNNSVSKAQSQLGLRLVILAVAFNGILIIAGTLPGQFITHNRLHIHLSDAIFGIPLIIGLTLIYLSSLLARRKQTAWIVSLAVYAFIVGLNFVEIILLDDSRHLALLAILRGAVLPILIIVGLLYYSSEFTVKSDLQSFKQSLRFIVIILVITFIYGVAGFMLMDNHDFHQEIGFVEAMHRTVDQFGLTTSHNLVPYTRRARIFVTSLSIISIGSLVYIVFSLFQPLKNRFIERPHNRDIMARLLKYYPASSEDFFKLWPHDKIYFFNSNQQAGLALHIQSGVALVIGDPSGDPQYFPGLMSDFINLCYGNDWRPAFVHTEPHFNNLYRSHGLKPQKIGEEAILDLEHFQDKVVGNKYFRQINNKFTKQGYSAELLKPPHHAAVIKRLRIISKDWLSQPGRTERGLIMGYFTPEYMEQCHLMVIRDGAGTIQAFINQLPDTAKDEANFDLLRHTNDSLGNINDFLLMNFIKYLHEHDHKRLNLGLCPLKGLDKQDENYTVFDSVLRFAYANGDRFYSFSGLEKFKSKYEPNWSSRYIAYRGGASNFVRTLNALLKAMKVKRAQLDR